MESQVCPIKHLFIVPLLVAMIGAAAADELVVGDATVLSGELLRIESGKVRFKSDFAGVLNIKSREVSGFKLDAPRKLLLENGAVIEVLAGERSGSSMLYSVLDGKDAVLLQDSEIKCFRPEAWELGRGFKYEGSANLAVKNESGNSDKNELNGDVSFKMKNSLMEFVLVCQVEYDTSRSRATSDNWSGLANYVYMMREHWYTSGLIAVKHDKFADMRLRTLFGLSPLGWRFADGTHANFQAELGAFYLDDDFYDEKHTSYMGPGWHMNGDLHICEGMFQLYHRQVGFVTLNSSGKWLWRSWQGVRMPLSGGLVGSIEYELDFDSKPAIEAETTDSTIRLKMGYKW
jgi:putative salt-induced outer membrane protein YdiY